MRANADKRKFQALWKGAQNAEKRAQTRAIADKREQTQNQRFFAQPLLRQPKMCRCPPLRCPSLGPLNVGGLPREYGTAKAFWSFRRIYHRIQNDYRQTFFVRAINSNCRYRIVLQKNSMNSIHFNYRQICGDCRLNFN